MKIIVSILFAGLLIFISSTASAQKDKQVIYSYVDKLGSMDTLPMGTISKLITARIPSPEDKALAIYYWIATHIDYDVKASRNYSTSKNTPTEVLQYRKAVGIGFASLFQDMCSSANIRCLTVDGFAKNTTEEINEKGAEINHSWAVVQLGQSPDTWHYVDVARGSGYFDAEMKVFTKDYTDAYFFADKTIFNLDHYPDNDAWKLGTAPKNKKDFYALPLIKRGAYELGLQSVLPKDGELKEKTGSAIAFIYKLNNADSVKKVVLGMGERKRYKETEMRFNVQGSQLRFDYTFKEDASYPITVIINGKEVISYRLEIE